MTDTPVVTGILVLVFIGLVLLIRMRKAVGTALSSAAMGLAAMGAVPQGVECIAVDTAKQANYVTGCYPDPDEKLQVCYGTTDECVDAALTGRWRGEWR